MIREKCVICDSDKLESFLSYSMPVYSGASDSNCGYIFNEMTFCECQNCKTVQLLDLIDPNLVYMTDHNSEIISGMWSNHYKEFCNFIGNLENKTVLEIGDPAAKVAKLCEGYNKWIIVEPNSKSSNNNKIEFVPKFFDENFKINQKIDLIVHSHFFEHTYNPKSILSNMFKLINAGDFMYFSVPNLDHLLETGYQPNNVLHFEHTFFFDLERITYLLNTSGFKIIEVQNFKNHSLFFKCVKDKPQTINNPKFLNVREKFEKSFNYYKNLIQTINKEIHKYDEVILFGCHMSSQFLLSNGLSENDIDFVADNAVNKQNKYLYGFDLKTISPSDINPDKNVLVILIHSGIYFKEIKQSLKKLNKKITVI